MGLDVKRSFVLVKDTHYSVFIVAGWTQNCTSNRSLQHCNLVLAIDLFLI